MKDLKHMIYFEHLLEDAHNDLVRQAKSDGRLAFGYTCYHVPEVLMNLGNCFSVRLRAPNTGSVDIATYYMANSACEYSRALLERAIEGNYNYLDGLFGVDVCEPMNRAMENMALLHLHDDHEKFVRCYLDIPYADDEDCVQHLKEQLTRKILNPLHEVYGVDVSDAAIRAAVGQYNKVCKVVREIGNFRKQLKPVITGSEFHKICLVSFVCPKDLILPYLEETLEELKSREPDETSRFKARVGIVGSEIDDPTFIELVEDSGALVVFDRFCYGSIPGRNEIILTDDEDALTQICRQNLKETECPRNCAYHKLDYRKEHVKQLHDEYKADGVIYEQMKFCTYWSFERTLASHVMPEEYGIHVLSIDRPYIARSSGQLRTRVQAFVESLEFKKIKSKKQAGEN